MTNQKPLLAAMLPAHMTPAGRLTVNVFMAVLGSVVIWTSAKVQVPFYPVPMTMQALVILMIGAAYGWKLGMATVGLYLLEGAMGLPVFSGTPEKGIGMAYMAGPTGGYLLGFWLAAGVVGWLAEKGWDRNVFTLGAAMTIGMAVIYIPGVSWLGSLIGFEKAIEFGALPFLLGDATKIVLGAVMLPAVWKGVRKNG